MKTLIVFLLTFLCLASIAQTIPLSFSTLSPANTDIKRPGGGAEQWNEANQMNLYGSSSSTQSLDAYERFSYTDIQPYMNARGSYSTAYFDMKIQGAIQKRQKFSFSIMPVCDYCTGQGNNQAGQPAPGGAYLFYPLWLHNAMQAENPKDFIRSSTGAWWPNWNSPTWLAAWKDMNSFLNNYIMTASYQGVRYKDVVEYVDVSGYGQAGEWTNIEWHGGGTDATVPTLDSIYAYTARIYSSFKVVSQIAVFDGQQVKGNTNIPASVGWFALQFQNGAGHSGIRRENFGTTDAYVDWWLSANHTTYTVPSGFSGAGSVYHFDSAIANRYKYAPFTGEPCCATNSFADLTGQMSSYHVALIGNGNIYSYNGDMNTMQNNFRTAARAAGYGLQITGGQLQLTATSLSVNLNWRNSGVAPTYEHWKIEYQLLQGSIVKWSGTSSFDPYLFVPGADKSVTDPFSIQGVPAGGGYTLKIFIRDPNGYRAPMPLFITSVQNSDGSYNLQTNLTLGTSTPTTPPPTPPPTPPTAAVTTIFTTQTPVAVTDNDHQGPVGQEVGLRFKSSVAGTITGIRFYKTSGNTGTHVGEFYSSSGTRLAQATFSGETATGWQTVQFATPVSIAANTTYIAAYFSSLGYYTEELDYFLHRSLINGTLTAVEDGTNGASGTDPGNGQGMYVYTSSPKFPNQLYRASNYWLDVFFKPNTTGTTAAGAEKNTVMADTLGTVSGQTSDTLSPAVKTKPDTLEISHYSLSQNYPNPTGAVTIINYQAPRSGKIQIILRDVTGRQIKVLVNEVKPAGNYSYYLNTSGMGKGMYYYSMDALQFHDVKKMLVE
jgi:hypothetical protein